MPPSVHKVLIHGADIMESFEFAIGLTSEEAQENNNKYVRKARLEHSRMTGRKETNEDMFKHLLVNSDPFLVNYRIRTERKPMVKSRVVIEILK